MTTEKGGALVRSAPGLVGGVDTYNPHIGKGTNWEPSTPPQIPVPGKKPQQPQSNATVTKLSSGGRGGVSPKNLPKKKSNEKTALQNGIIDEEEGACGCDAWTRARQMEHDFVQLHKIHESVLKGLHLQIEELKQKNRDLTFQLLMGPYATSVHVDAPQSPESDSLSSLKEENKKEDKSTSTSETELDSVGKVEETANLDRSQHVEVTSQGVKTYVQRRQRKGRLGDPRQVRSLDMELLEEEADELRKRLEEERTKNQYLITLTEDLKRQIREEAGSWNPPQLLATKRSMQPPLKQTTINRLMNTGTSFRLPQIPRADSKMQQYSTTDEPAQPQESSAMNQQQQIATGNHVYYAEPNRKFDKNRPTLPAIRRQSDDISLRSEVLPQTKKEPAMEYRVRQGELAWLAKSDIYSKEKSQSSPPQSIGSNKAIGPSQTDSAKSGKPLNRSVSDQSTTYGYTQMRKDQRSRKQPEFGGSDVLLQDHREQQSKVRNQQPMRHFISDQLHQQDQPENSRRKELAQNKAGRSSSGGRPGASPSNELPQNRIIRRSTSGSRTRVRGTSRSRTIKSRDSSKSENVATESPLTTPQAKVLENRGEPVSAPPDLKPSSRGQKSSTVSSEVAQPVTNSSPVQTTDTTEPRERRTGGGKIPDAGTTVNSKGSDPLSSKSTDATMATSSSSVGSLASGSAKPKHKRQHRRGRGRGRNKRENAETQHKGNEREQ